MAQCRSLFICNGVGKGFITDYYVKDAVTRGRSNVARVSEYTAEPTMATSTVTVGTLAATEEFSKEAERRSGQLCSTILHRIYSSGGSTPTVAIFRSIKEVHKLGKQWRNNRTRQLEEHVEGLGKFTTDELYGAWTHKAAVHSP